jgi:hypothetical protein
MEGSRMKRTIIIIIAILVIIYGNCGLGFG